MENNKKIFHIMIFGFLILKLFLLIYYHDIRWDESVSIGMGKFLFSGGKIGLWETLRPIGLPILLGFLWRLGLDMIWAVEILSVLFAVGCLIMTFKVAEFIFNRKVALYSVILMVFTPVFFYLSSYGFANTPSTFFALVSIYFLLKKKHGASGIFAAISFMFRFTQGMLLASGLAYLLLKKHKASHIAAFIIGFGVIILPFFVFNQIQYNDPLLPFKEASLHQNTPVHSVLDAGLASKIYNLFYYVIELLKQNLLYAFGFISIYLLSLSKKDLKLKCSVILMQFILFFSYLTYIINKQDRFILDFLPYIAMLSAYGIAALMGENKNKIVMKGIILISIILSASAIGVRYFYRSPAIPEIYGMYTFFDGYRTNLTVLTMTPIPIAYSDIKMVPMYNNVDDAVLIYSQSGYNNTLVLYSSEFYPCYNEECLKKRGDLFENIKNRYDEIYHFKENQDYFIFYPKALGMTE